MVYLDHAATSFPKPEVVYRGMDAFARASGVNPGRGGYRAAVLAEGMIEDTRRLLARLLGCRRPERIVFALNATDAINMAIKGVLHPGDHVITSVLEHNAVARPLNRMEKEGGIQLTRLPVGSDNKVDPDSVFRAFQPSTKLVVLTHVSNVTGTVQPVEVIGPWVRDRGALFLVDASQSVGVVPVAFEQSCVDLLAFTGHKGLLGPTGTGGLVVGERASVACWREGGTGGDSSSPMHPEQFPHRLEGGTPNVVGLAGLREGVRFVLERGVQNILAHERELMRAFRASLANPEHFHWYGADRADNTGIVAINIPGWDPVELAAVLDGHHAIAVRAGLHCAPYTHRHLGTFPNGCVRLSVGALSTVDDVQEAAVAFNALAVGC